MMGNDLADIVSSKNFVVLDYLVHDLIYYPRDIYFNKKDHKDTSDKFFRFLGRCMSDESITFTLKEILEAFDNLTGYHSDPISNDNNFLQNELALALNICSGVKDNSIAIMKIFRGKRTLIKENFEKFIGYEQRMINNDSIEALSEFYLLKEDYNQAFAI